MQLLRKNILANTTTEFKFDVKSYDFLVKNLTEDDIYVCLGEVFDENKSILIPSYTSQVITMNTDHNNSKYLTDTLQIKSSVEGKVEIQCLGY